ncbi:MAG: hypothetical protein AVDCRST_MAG08-1035 [uncultured Acetobacteraceae bacterium]|uniref:Uncharacterized protein n=1 Tax=uncultured Acetobacteraceae bacterium TaxID=169975 RepID=A0A6J4HQ93_9PROT|nr:MAG: hypothetical protein AVDCRST_MAG08-1035 [uncultured Acetobacteraceae bacterium]
MTAILPFLAAGGSGDATSWEGSDAPVWDAERSRTAAGVGLWSWNVDTDEVAMDDCCHALWGVPWDGPSADLAVRIVPPDRDRLRAAFAATRAAPGAYQIDFRVRHGDEAVR